MKRRTSFSTMKSKSTTEQPGARGVVDTIFARTGRFSDAFDDAAARVRIRLQLATATNRSSADGHDGDDAAAVGDDKDRGDAFNYALLIALYTLQGIPMGLSASIPFLIQQKIGQLAGGSGTHASLAADAAQSVVASAATAGSAARLSYNANAIFALCSWPFSLKLVWAPIVDACFLRRVGRRKSWIVPVQATAGILMVLGANFVERELGLDFVGQAQQHRMVGSINVVGVTAFFFVLYFLMATQDIAVDGWALTMLSKKNRGRGPICNSIGQNIGYFLSFVGFLALNDNESSETLWRPLLGLPSNPGQGLVSLGSFIRFMGYFMLATTTAVAIFKQESRSSPRGKEGHYRSQLVANKKIDDDRELDASEIGLKETYFRLWAVCKLPSVRWLFLILLTYRLPTSLSDNVRFLKAVEYGLSKSTTAVSVDSLSRMKRWF